MLALLGKHTLAAVAEMGDLALFTGRTLVAAKGARRLGRRVLMALREQGVRCMPVILIVGLFTGLVLGLQGYFVLVRFGSKGALGTLVALTLTRELAPVLAAIMIVGQAGSALASELGIQRNSEQIAALETMGIDPHGYLVTPRLLGSLLAYPLLTAIFTVVGLIGGWLSGSFVLALESGLYWSAVERSLELSDLRECLLKALVFGLLATAICSYNGFTAHRRHGTAGAQAVGISATRAVVWSSIAILASDYAITSLLA
jgi:phospholipid/cholesterol/gamma-HCH transport system permease protein